MHWDNVRCNEIRKKLEEMTAADYSRAYAAARYFVWNPYDAEDLLQEAYLRLLQGSRSAPPDIPIIITLIMTMRSIASNGRVAVRRRPELVSIDDRDVPAREPSPEDLFIAEERREQFLKAVNESLKDDPVAFEVLKRTLAGQSGREIEAEMGLTPTQYQAARRRGLRALWRFLRGAAA